MEFFSFEGIISVILFGLFVNELYKRYEKGREKREKLPGQIDKDRPGYEEQK